LQLDVDRTLATTMGMSQRDVADSVLVTLSSSAMVAPNFWLDPKNNVSYPLVVQTPDYTVDSMDALSTMPLTGKGDRGMTNNQLLMNVARISRAGAPMILSQLNIRSVFDIHADAQGRDLGGIAAAIDRVVAADQPDASSGVKVFVSGQIETMRESFKGLATGIGLAVVLVYLLMVLNFQSWVDPLIVLMAVPFALGGIIWMLYASHTHISVPALMGTLMCIGLTTANSILVVTFANQKMDEGEDALTAAISSGYTRLRPVLMTAGAMILGMTPMALGVGEGGEQNAPLGRAVIGGLIFATFATLIFVPVMYRLMRGRSPRIALEPYTNG
jgi:multidrug efflux pump subunit AcrB